MLPQVTPSGCQQVGALSHQPRKGALRQAQPQGSQLCYCAHRGNHLGAPTVHDLLPLRDALWEGGWCVGGGEYGQQCTEGWFAVVKAYSS